MQIIKTKSETRVVLPFFSSLVPAGFPSPAEDYTEAGIDLNQKLVPHPNSTFLVRVEGDSMIGAKIFTGDLLVIDRSVEAKTGDVILAVVDGEFTVKRYKLHPRGVILEPANPRFDPIVVRGDMTFQIWGVVTNTIRSIKN
jgi:DNA polymerase V